MIAAVEYSCRKPTLMISVGGVEVGDRELTGNLIVRTESALGGPCVGAVEGVIADTFIMA